MDRPWIEAGLKYASVRRSDLPCLLVQRVARLRGINGLNTDYLRYVIGSPEFTAHVKSITTGVNVPHISGKDIKRFQFALPPTADQRRIASILGAYDDLIEVNRRRIALLEEMARRLFEEWFVHFRFPGHEDHAMVETPDGPVPDGWSRQKVDDAFNVVGGGTPSKAEATYWAGGTINWYTPSDLTGAGTSFMDASSLKITNEGLRRSSARLFPPFSVMMTSRATIGVISINTTNACTNQGFITCIPNDRIPLCYLFHWLHANVPLFISQATGSTFKEITKGVFRKLSIVLPPAELTSVFERRTRPMIEAVLVLERIQRRLATSRDLLLPRLISGEVSVATAERELQAVA
jgi:type I restriction enzyme S subunit